MTTSDDPWWRDPDEFWHRYEDANWNLAELCDQHDMARQTMSKWKNRHERQSGKRTPVSAAELRNHARRDRHDQRLKSAGTDPPAANVTVTVREIDPAELVDLRRKLDRVTREAASLRKQMKTGIEHANLIDDVAAMAAPMLDQYPMIFERAQAAPLIQPPSSGTPVEVVVYLTDWHIGEHIDEADVQGRNSYSIEIAAQRVEHLAQVLCGWLDWYCTGRGVSRVVFAVLGDMVNNAGLLHADQSTDVVRVLAQSLDASLLMYQTIIPVIDREIPVTVVTTRGGNHGRATRKMPSGPAAAQTSWDGVAYEHLAAMLRGHAIDWHMSRAYSATIEIAGRTFWMAHGDAVKGGGGALGIPAYGAKRSSDAAIMASVLEAIQRDCAGQIVQHVRIGHFHEETLIRLPTGTFKICPSIKGVSAWELDTLGKISQPEALIEVVHPVHGLIASHVVDCANPAGDGFVTGALRSTIPAAALVD